jgi:hypothetical protein
MLAEISTAFGVLKGGIELVRDFEDEQVDIRFSVRDMLMSAQSPQGESVLAFVTITNASSSPQSITDIALDFGEEKAQRLPILNLESEDTANELLSARLYTYAAHFEREADEFRDFRVLPDDIYLKENESRSGAALFELPDLDEVSAPALEVIVGADKLLSRNLEE